MAASSILLYNCEGQEWKKLHNLMALLRLRLRPVKTEQLAVAIGDLAVGKGDITATPYQGEGFTEPMIVLCNIHQAQLNPILEVIRRAEIPVQPIKAMMTQPTWAGTPSPSTRSCAVSAPPWQNNKKRKINKNCPYGATLS